MCQSQALESFAATPGHQSRRDAIQWVASERVVLDVKDLAEAMADDSADWGSESTGGDDLDSAYLGRPTRSREYLTCCVLCFAVIFPIHQHHMGAEMPHRT